MRTVAELVVEYLLWLELNDPKRHSTFSSLLQNNIDAAKAEAVVFSWLRSKKLDPKIKEDFVTPLPDFECNWAGGGLVVEVTTLGRDAVTQRSGWPETTDEAADSFSFVTAALQNAAKKKVRQLTAHLGPRVLVIACLHIAADVLVTSRIAAKYLVTSETRISVPLDGSGETRTVTDLERSVFFRIEDGRLVACRRPISLILLMSIFDESFAALGLLHPDPNHHLDGCSVFPDIPFLRVANWPCNDGVIRTEWVIGQPEAAKHDHQSIDLASNLKA